MLQVLVTGGSGYFGGLLKRRLLDEGFWVTNVDLLRDKDSDPRLVSLQGDLRDRQFVDRALRTKQFAAVFHCAALLAHGRVDERMLWESNVEGTRNVAEACSSLGIPKLVFISTNCLWATNPGHPIGEDETPAPVEVYGRSKLAAELLLQEYARHMTVITLRPPTIISEGRLGLLAILFEFIRDNRTVWVVGDGSNRYQFIYAQDLATACLRSLRHDKSDLFHVGSANIKPLRTIYETVIDEAGSSSRVRSLPRRPAVGALKLAHKLRISPLGPYHYGMIAENFEFDTARIRRELNWWPTLTNEEMLIRAYRYYAANWTEVHRRTHVSAHSMPSSMGILRLVKWLS